MYLANNYYLINIELLRVEVGQAAWASAYGIYPGMSF